MILRWASGYVGLHGAVAAVYALIEFDNGHNLMGGGHFWALKRAITLAYSIFITKDKIKTSRELFLLKLMDHVFCRQ